MSQHHFKNTKMVKQNEVEKELYDVDSRTINSAVKIPITLNVEKSELKLNGQKIPDPKLHQTISFIKSGIRIFACIAGFSSFYGIGFFGLLIAEIVGIYEELV